MVRGDTNQGVNSLLNFNRVLATVNYVVFR